MIAVSAVGSQGVKSYYSSYGAGVVTVAAPGGDAQFQIPDTPDRNGRVLSTLPGNKYGYMQGTSMATPHVTGVVALLASAHPGASPAELAALLTAEAHPIACPAAPSTPAAPGPGRPPARARRSTTASTGMGSWTPTRRCGCR